jgi:hypothetical protein
MGIAGEGSTPSSLPICGYAQERACEGLAWVWLTALAWLALISRGINRTYSRGLIRTTG